MSYVPAAIRNQVIERAEGRCEYCLYPQAVSFLAFEIEHIIAEKHGGKTVLENLALACPFCNRFKGTDLGSLDPESGILTPFFNPRTQHWHDHFHLIEGQIVPLTPAGRVTTLILQLNHPDRVLERQRLLDSGVTIPTH
ncbi:MAG: HNH endonuclease [Caldilineaceae bacterium]|nr:HNH endonuclease [Caldilineaceae bacterium]